MKNLTHRRRESESLRSPVPQREAFSESPMRTIHIINVVFLSAALMGQSALRAADIPRRPEDIQFKPLAFEPPKAADYRHVLPNGVVVFMAPDHELPLINMVFTFKGGSFMEPQDQIGLASATGSMMRRGGTATVSASDLDEQFDFLATQAGSFIGDTTAGANLNCLTSNFDDSFALFMDMIRNPGFQQDRLDVYKSEVIEALKQRNDDAGPILSREWNALMYGSDHFEAAQPTKASIESLTVDDLKAFHDRVFRPSSGSMFVAVSGDFDPDQMLKKLEAALAGWEPGSAVSDPPPPKAALAPGVYHVEKDIPQGKVQIGMRSIQRDDPDYFPMLLMNQILGGGGFTSRITNRVRSDEGLAYSAGSSFIPRVYYPGEFRAGFQSKNPTCALATRIIMEEIEKIRTQPVTDAELEIAKNSFIETFPRTFESKAGMLNVFVSDEITNRPADYWQSYRDKIRAVTAEQVMDVATRRLRPEEMAIVMVGKWSEIEPGDLQGRASMKEFYSGQVTHLPLRDPLTLEPLQN
jgi:zinc protease